MMTRGLETFSRNVVPISYFNNLLFRVRIIDIGTRDDGLEVISNTFLLYLLSDQIDHRHIRSHG